MMSGLNESVSKSVFQAAEKEANLLSEVADKITETDTKPFSSAIFESSTEKDLEDDFIPQIKFQSEYSYEEMADYHMAAVLSSVKNRAACAEEALFQCPKGDFKSVFAHDSDDEIPPFVKVQDGVPTVSENGQMKLVTSSTIKTSLDFENVSTCSQKCESVKNSTDENLKTAEPSNSLTNVDSGADTNKLLQTFDKVLTVNPSNKSNGEKEGGDRRMTDMPMINITISEKLKYVSLSSTEKVFVPKNAVEDNTLPEIPELVNGKMSEIPMTNIKVSERELHYPSLSSTEKVFVPRNALDEPLRSTSSPITDHNATNADEDNDLPELVPLYMSVKSPTQLKIDYFRELEGSSGRCESPPHMSPRKLFPKSKSPSSLEKPSLKKATTEKAVIESEHSIVPVLQSSVACGLETIRNKTLEPENQICSKCEGQVIKTSEGKEEIKKCIPKSKHLYCIGISGPKRHAKNMDPKVICTGRRFRILLDVSLFENKSLSICKMVDKIDVYGKQVLKNEYGEEIHEVHQVFRIPLFVDDSCFTASITESEMLLIDAPFKGNEEENIKK